MNIDLHEIDNELSEAVIDLAARGTLAPSALMTLTIEKLRRLEDRLRSSGEPPQEMQKVMSARRILGDFVNLGPYDLVKPSENGIHTGVPHRFMQSVL